MKTDILKITAMALALALGYVLSPPGWADDCRSYTPEQQWLLGSARYLGGQYGYAAQVSAMMEVESFWGDEVRRADETLGAGKSSYGVMQMLPTTALHLLRMPATEENIAWVTERLKTDDIFALELGLEYFLGHTWRGVDGAIRRYNGSGWQAERHLSRVQAVIERAERCGVFG